MSLFDFWNKKSPPLPELFAAYVGFKREEPQDDLDNLYMAKAQGIVAEGARPWGSIPADVREAILAAQKKKKE